MPRFLHQLYAGFFGYFWLPCPVCHRYFGGHECGKKSVPASPGYGHVVCNDPACNDAAERITMLHELHRTLAAIMHPINEVR